MTKKQINELQKEFKIDKMQQAIINGTIWGFEGHMGRMAMDSLKSGMCYLGDSATNDYYGNRIPSIHEVQEGTMGSLQNAINFWSDDYNLIQLEDEINFNAKH
jgi:hypothetical protein